MSEKTSDSATAPQPDDTIVTNPVGLEVIVRADGKVVARFDIEKNPADTSGDTGRNLAGLMQYVGADAMARLHGPKEARWWANTVFFLFQERKKDQEQVSGYPVLKGILEGSTEPVGSWSWYQRRIDGTIRLVRRGDDGTVLEEVVESCPGNAFRNILRALNYSDGDDQRVLGQLYAGFGIPYVNGDSSALPMAEGEQPRGPAEAERALLRAVQPFLSYADQERARLRASEITSALVAAPELPKKDTGPADVKRLAEALALHPVRARQLALALRRSQAEVSILADALDLRADTARGDQHTISITPPRPTLEGIKHLWRRNTDVDEKFVQRQFDGALATWKRLYSRVPPKRSNNLVRRAISAMRFDWDAHGDTAREVYDKRFGFDAQSENLVRWAVRPWPERGWRGVEVGNVRFGIQPKPKDPRWKPLRKSATPHDLYRLFYLFNPTNLNFNDMYGDGLFGVVSPCHRFAMSFYFHKFELAAYQYVRKEFAVRTREERGQFRIRSGIPGSDNGVATMHADAKRFFRMIFIALHREWMVYGGNNFEV